MRCFYMRLLCLFILFLFVSVVAYAQIGIGTWQFYFLAILGAHSCGQIVFLFRIDYHALNEEKKNCFYFF